MTTPQGIILWEGDSLLLDDPHPIAVIATGICNPSTNRKTGAMVQVYIIRTDVAPVEAIRSGIDDAVCGDCPLRGAKCYVNAGHGPRAVFAAYHAGNYPRQGEPGWNDGYAALDGRDIRFGSYGDPAAAPAVVWHRLVAKASSHTGYTHQWRSQAAVDLAGICMASTHGAAETIEAWGRGWATFRVLGSEDDPRLPGEAVCPASEEAGHKVQCISCPMPCDGTIRRGNAGRVIRAHGAGASRF